VSTAPAIRILPLASVTSIEPSDKVPPATGSAATHTYKTPTFVIHSLIDIVSRNGNLLLSVPLRGDGTLDEDEHAFLAGLASWMRVHGVAIYGTRPFAVFGEGPPDAAAAGTFNEKRQRPYTTEDIRFVTKGDILYAFAFVWPNDGKLLIKTLAGDPPPSRGQSSAWS
jgi:alpha-L-fucosidase